MARTKRKVNPVLPVTPPAAQSRRMYQAGGYVRLSVEDSGKPGADTIATQRELIQSYIDSQGNLTAGLGYTPAEQSRTLANLLLAAIDYPEDLDIHLQKAIIHTDTGIDLIPANRRLADAAARLQVMQLSQYNAVGDS